MAATPFFVEQVEALQGLRPAKEEPPPGAFWRSMVGRLARTRTSRRLERWTLSWRELESVEHARDEQQRKAFRRAEERAGSDPVRLSTLRSRAEAFEQARVRRLARQQEREEQWAIRDAGLLHR